MHQISPKNKKCIGMSKEFAEEWNRTSTASKFVYVDTNEVFGWILRDVNDAQ